MKLRAFCMVVIASAFALTASAPAQQSSGKKADKSYQVVQVNRFEVQQGVDLPPDYQMAITEDLVKELGKIKGMKQVLRDGEALPEGQPVLLVTGTVTNYKKGNQAARYLVGFGAGSTVIDAHLKCVDANTKEVLLERDVDGKVIIGVMGGKSEGANNGLAKEVAKNIKKTFF